MKRAALVLGVLGGILTPIGMFFLVEAVGREGLEEFILLEFAVGPLLAGAVGIIGGLSSIAKPRLAAALMLVAGLWAAAWGWFALTFFGWPLLLTGAILAFLGQRRRHEKPMTTEKRGDQDMERAA